MENADTGARTQLIHELDDVILRDWVEKLIQANVHPVLVFGTTYSGKTTMLQSLLYFARTSPTSRMDISYGDPVFSYTNPIWQERINEGRTFFELGVADFGNRKPTSPTGKIFPFFIPVTIVVRRETLKFAFLEGNGEWYQRKTHLDLNASIFTDFKAEISTIMTSFTKPVSVVFVAPSAMDSHLDRDLSDEGLTNCIEQYKTRRNGERDNLLLLFSKWDMLCDPADRAGNFTTVTGKDLLKKVEGRRFLWTKFSSLQVPDTAAKAVMPYSASWMQDGKYVAYDQPYQTVFDKFNKTLWNWLYGNAVAAQTDAPPEARAVLYDDVDVRRSTFSKYYLALAGLLLWAGSSQSGDE